MIHKIIALFIVFSIFVVALTSFLGPDDLRSCEGTQSSLYPCKKVDAIVAISGGDTDARTLEAVYLYKLGWADTLIFSGAAEDKTGPSNAEAMRKIAIDAGVSSRAILIDDQAETTKENAQNVKNIIIAQGIQDIILVTSGYHQRRANLEFEQTFSGFVRIINHPVPKDKHWSSWWWLTPYGWYLATSESIKIGMFYIGGTR